ncbi:hypothetical protein [Domibacillus robiginosus]|uniref:hypothetical protein n=1 Tax=Domibacillus robiginosus TaxID=1071054 RepID=UPI00067B03BF|nr:hypothetical protein [Domibacillus robiginosus]
MNNKYGYLSVMMPVISVIFFFIKRGLNSDIYLAIIVYSILSLLGIMFAIMSKRTIPMILGILSNGGVLACAFLLLLAMGISEA